MDEFEDEELTCRECAAPFLWTAGEQRFYQERDYPPPRRCRECRPLQRARRAEYEARRLPSEGV